MERGYIEMWVQASKGSYFTPDYLPNPKMGKARREVCNPC